MYADPDRVRNNRITTNFDNYEHKLLTALAEFKGIEPAVLVREITLQAALELISFPQSQDMRTSTLNQAVEKLR